MDDTAEFLFYFSKGLCKIYMHLKISASKQQVQKQDKNLQILGLRTWKIIIPEKIWWLGHLESLISLSILKFNKKGQYSSSPFITNLSRKCQFTTFTCNIFLNLTEETSTFPISKFQAHSNRESPNYCTGNVESLQESCFVFTFGGIWAVGGGLACFRLQ